MDLLQPTVQDGVDTLTRLQVPGDSETVADHRFHRVAPLWPAATAQCQGVQALPLPMHPCQVKADEAARDRGLCIGQGDLRVHHHTELDFGHPFDGGQLVAQDHWRTFDMTEHIGQAVVAVKTVAGSLERFVHRKHAHKTGYSNGHHHGDGEHLRPQALQVAPEFGVQGFHGQITSSGWPQPLYGGSPGCR